MKMKYKSNSKTMMYMMMMCIVSLMMNIQNSQNKIPIIMLSMVFMGGIAILFSSSMIMMFKPQKKNKKKKMMMLLMIIPTLTMTKMTNMKMNQSNLYMKSSPFMFMMCITTMFIMSTMCLNMMKKNSKPMKSM